MGWSEKYKRSIDCDNPKGFSQRAHCQGRKKSLKEQLKSFKTVKQIAKKHRLSISFIQRQLDMGEKIEHEHTKNHDLAKEIALQHLDEIPDYYTRLKKMEADAKKHHKKFKDVKEETSSGDEGLRDWFGKSKSSDGKPGWVQLGGKWSGKPCARQPGQTSTPKCGSSKMKRALSKDEEEAARIRKNRLDPNQPEKSGGAKPTNVRTEEMDLQEVKDKPGKGSGKKDACYHKVKSRYSVWPSAYASGALVKCRKVGADNWGTKSEEVQMQRYCPKCEKNETREECKYGPKYWEMFSTPISLSSDAYDPNRPHPANEEKDHEYSMARSELSTIVSAAKRLKKKMGKGEGSVEAWVQSKITKASDYLDSAADYVDSGEMKVESVSNEPKLKPGSGLGGGKPVYLPGKQPKPTGAKLFPLAKGEGGSPYEPYNKPKGPSQPTQPPGGFDKFREKYGIPKKPSLQMAHFVPEDGLVDEQVVGTETMSDSDRYRDFDVSVKKIRERQKRGRLSSSELVGSLKRAAKVRPVDENLTLQDADGNDFVQIIDVIRPEKIKGSVNEKCWDGYEQLGMKKKGKKMVPNCVKKEEYSNWREELAEDWQKVNRKDKTDGLSQAAVDAYRRENPGSKLQTAVTEKKPKGKRAKRRANFCRRMRGMKDKLTSVKTARDPDSRINKALRRWRCN